MVRRARARSRFAPRAAAWTESSSRARVALLVLVVLGPFLPPETRARTQDGPEAGPVDPRAAMDPISRLFLRPDPALLPVVAAPGVKVTHVAFPGSLGATLRGTFLDAPDTDRVVFLCGGIRGNHTYLSPYALFLNEAGFDVLLFDYAGFGASDGVASAARLLDDARAARRYVRSGLGRARDQVAAFGISLGSVLALAVAAEDGLGAVVAEDVYVPRAHFEVLKHRYANSVLARLAAAAVERGVLPAIDPIANLRRFEGPVLLICGVEDRVLPARGTVEVALARPKGTRVCLLPETGHAPESLEVNDRDYAGQITGFLAQALGPAPGAPREWAPRVGFEAVPGAPETWDVTLDLPPGPGTALRIALTDGARFHFARRVLVPRPTRVVERLAFAPTAAFSVVVADVRLHDDLTFEEELSPRSAALRDWREFARAVIGDVIPASAKEPGPLWQSARRLLPAADAVDPWVRPRYARFLAALALRLAQDRRRPEAVEAARRMLPFLPAQPASWVQLGNGTCEIGLTDPNVKTALRLLLEEARRAPEPPAAIDALQRTLDALP